MPLQNARPAPRTTTTRTSVVARQVVDERVQIARPLLVRAVQDVRAVERQGRDPVVHGGIHGFELHAASPSSGVKHTELLRFGEVCHEKGFCVAPQKTRGCGVFGSAAAFHAFCRLRVTRTSDVGEGASDIAFAALHSPSSSFRSDRDNRVDAGRATARDISSQKGHTRQHRGGYREYTRVQRGNAEKQASQERGQRDDEQETPDDTDANRCDRLRNHHATHLRRCSPHCNPNGDLTCLAPDGVEIVP